MPGSLVATMATYPTPNRIIYNQHPALPNGQPASGSADVSALYLGQFMQQQNAHACSGDSKSKSHGILPGVLMGDQIDAVYSLLTQGMLRMHRYADVPVLHISSEARLGSSATRPVRISACL